MEHLKLAKTTDCRSTDVFLTIFGSQLTGVPPTAFHDNLFFVLEKIAIIFSIYHGFVLEDKLGLLYAEGNSRIWLSSKSFSIVPSNSFAQEYNISIVLLSPKLKYEYHVFRKFSVRFSKTMVTLV